MIILTDFLCKLQQKAGRRKQFAQYSLLWLRALVAIGFAFGFTRGVIALGAVVLVCLGMARSEAVMVFALAGFPIYLLAGLWAVISRRLWRTALLLAGCGVLATVLAQMLVRWGVAA